MNVNYAGDTNIAKRGGKCGRSNNGTTINGLKEITAAKADAGRRSKTQRSLRPKRPTDHKLSEAMGRSGSCSVATPVGQCYENPVPM